MTADMMYPLMFAAVVVMTLVWSFAQWRVRRHSIRYQAAVRAAFAHQAARERVELARQASVRASEQLAQARATGAAVDLLLSRYATPRELTSTGQRAA